MTNFDFAVVKCATLSTGKTDKNGLESIILDVVAGRMPKNRVISGTIAERGKFNDGEIHLISIEELPSNEYGDQYRFKSLGIQAGFDLVKTCREFGKGIVVEAVQEIKIPA